MLIFQQKPAAVKGQFSLGRLAALRNHGASAFADVRERGGSGDRPLGRTMTDRVMLRGPTQHDAYQAGRIALLERLSRDDVN